MHRKSCSRFGLDIAIVLLCQVKPTAEKKILDMLNFVYWKKNKNKPETLKIEYRLQVILLSMHVWIKIYIYWKKTFLCSSFRMWLLKPAEVLTELPYMPKMAENIGDTFKLEFFESTMANKSELKVCYIFFQQINMFSSFFILVFQLIM